MDEFRTSKTCNSCTGELKSYLKQDRTRSHSRLCCETCGGEGLKPSKRLVDRDHNAALNILLAGTSEKRPTYMSRKRKACNEETETLPSKRRSVNKRPVGAGRTSSDPLSTVSSGESLESVTDLSVFRP